MILSHDYQSRDSNEDLEKIARALNSLIQLHSGNHEIFDKIEKEDLERGPIEYKFLPYKISDLKKIAAEFTEKAIKQYIDEYLTPKTIQDNASSWTAKVNHNDQPSKLNDKGSNDRSFKHRIKTFFACNSASIY